MNMTDRKVLLRANSNYFVMHALYAIGVARKVPHSRCATRILQSDLALNLNSDYRLGPRIPFQ